jgi:hypothetical protein
MQRSRTVPHDLETFFAMMAQSGAALLGLLFVTLSIRRSSPAIQQPVEAIVLADATFFSLADGFVVSSAALHPKLDVAYAALGMSAFGLVWATRALNFLRIEWARNASPELRRYRLRVIGPNLSGLPLNAAQIYAAVRLLLHAREVASLGVLATVVLAHYVIALLRAWTLVGGARYGLRSALAEAERAPTRVLLRERHLPPWPHVRHGPRGPNALNRPRSH